MLARKIRIQYLDALICGLSKIAATKPGEEDLHELAHHQLVGNQHLFSAYSLCSRLETL
jgi:hypothetical protein